MPIDYARRLTGLPRTLEGNRRLGRMLAFVAGATNAGGFLAVRQYTSHMTGIVSAIADNAVLGSAGAVFAGTGALVLCFIMGLHNAVITKVSDAEIRTTHVTGLVTDIGIELGGALHSYIDRSPGVVPARVDSRRLFTLVSLAFSFLAGGFVGALGFKQFGYVFTLPLALILVALAIVPAFDDILLRVRGAAR